MPRSKATVHFHTTVLPDGPEAQPDGLAACPVCSSPLDVLQPDPQDPDRMLWVCGDCRSWFVMYRDRRGHSVVVTLPALADTLPARRLARA